jgi:hypothetical protein
VSLPVRIVLGSLVETSPAAGETAELIAQADATRQVRVVPILLQKSLMASANSDSVAVMMRFATEARDDGAAQSGPRAAILFILS